ncbi:Flp pilus assembly complex ATPase component TadA [Ectothiorhodospiraceae bacterium 2226]|nr:Flp pilus assembly complex ATPase component TadA [Ectothiorhodospiraceae bacterium 2226]
MSQQKKLRIGDLLVEHKVISETQLQTALADQTKSGRKLGRVLIEHGYITEDQLLDFLSRQLRLPLVDLKHYQFNPATVRLLPETVARRYRVLALKDGADGVLVGMADPTDIFAFDELSRLLRRPVLQAVVREADLLRTLDLVYRRTDEISHLAEELGEEISQGDFDLAHLADNVSDTDAPVVKLLQTLFEDAVQVGASDIHIEPDEKVLRVRQRIDGLLHEHVVQERHISLAVVSRLKLMGGLNISEKRLPQDGRFNIRVKGRSIDVRLSTMPIQWGESVVMRLLDQSHGALDLEYVGMPPALLARFRRIIRKPHGLVLVTGPTGSGKTTTLYGALTELNTPAQKLITVEDPVEYRLPRVNQIQVHPRIGLTFATVLRAALRQDPDIVLVGEMRDHETAEIALRAAMTGHLVLSTLHTNDAISTTHRLLDMGAPGYLVASALTAVVAQRLVRRVCESCARPHEPSANQLAWLRSRLGERDEGPRFLRGQGCAHCNNTGYRGRVGVFELLEIDRALADALRTGDTVAFGAAAHAQEGFQTLADTALELALNGVTSLDEVLRIAGEIDLEVTDGAPAEAPPQGRAAGEAGA